jgi:hypothetical protein
MQVRHTIGQSRAEVQQRASWLFSHACVPVGRAGYDTLKQPEDASQLGYAVQGRDKVDLRSARIREADTYSGGYQRSDQAFCAIHFVIECAFQLK